MYTQAELPPQDDESGWNPPPDERDNGSFFSGFRAYRGDAEAAVAAAAATAAATAATAAAAPATTTAATTVEESKLEQGDDGSNTELRINGDARGREGGEAGVGTRGEGGLVFHHFPIPDLSPAENTEILSGLVDQLEALVASGRVRASWVGGSGSVLLYFILFYLVALFYLFELI